jgi:hypothetical protein
MHAPFVLALLITASTSLTAAQGTHVPGTSVTLEPPQGFTVASRFTGFERPDLQSSILVTEVVGPFSKLTAGLNEKGLASRGMALITSSRQQVDGKEALLLNVKQSAANGAEFLKWMLAVGDEKRTVMLVATFPKAAEAELSDAMRASVLSVHMTPPRAVDPFEGLSFRVTPTPTLKIAGRLNNLLLINESGTMRPQGPDAALFSVGTSVVPVPITDLPSFAKARVAQTKQLKDLRISQEKAITIDGLPGHEIVAEGTDINTGRVVTVYQVMLRDNDGYVLMQGFVASSRGAALVPEFRRVAESFKRSGR